MTTLTFTDTDGREITISGTLSVSELSRADLSRPIKLDGQPIQVVRIADGVVGVAWSERAPEPPHRGSAAREVVPHARRPAHAARDRARRRGRPPSERTEAERALGRSGASALAEGEAMTWLSFISGVLLGLLLPALFRARGRPGAAHPYLIDGRGVQGGPLDLSFPPRPRRRHE